MSFDFDAGASGSEGPWLQWSARGTLDGEIAPRNFLLRDENGKQTFTGFDKGVVLDVQNMKTGWCKSDGVAGQPPQWVWNPSIKTFQPRPSEEHKKGFSIRCAIGGGNAATWEQSGAGAWGAFVALVPGIQAGPLAEGKLPLVKQSGVKVEKYARGTTAIPTLEIVRWVDRPDCLKPDAIATEEPARTAKPAPASVVEDASEF